MNGPRLKHARILAGHTQGSLAEIIGTDARRIWQWESGIHSPKSDMIALLAKTLGVSSDYLLGLDENVKIASSDLSEKERELILALRDDDYQKALLLVATYNRN
ncbi:MAG: helix-turn-helix domain-containing protein [Anaerolineae bacterium]|nr:helix-turn-helix domain-containing protein [Anaerolineae bacterium]